MKAKFIHDCNICILFAQDSEYDFYRCENTLVARNGNTGPEYLSMDINSLRLQVEYFRNKGFNTALVKVWDEYVKT